MISFLVGRKNGPRVEIPKPPQRKSQKNLGAKSRKALKSKDFRKYLNWSYTPESPDFSRNQDFFRTFASNNLLAVFSDPNADPNGSG